MKKVLLVHNNYMNKGGEDTNLQDEVLLLKEKYIVETILFDNSIKLNLFDVLSFFTRSNLKSNKILLNKIKQFKPDVVYIHNTWFKANLGIFKLLIKNNIKTIIKIHNFRYECSRYWLLKNHLKEKAFCHACSKSKNKYSIFNKYFEESYIKSIILILYSKKYYKLLLSGMLHIFVINQFHKEKLIDLGVLEENLSVFHNPIKMNSEQNSYNPLSSYVVFAGRITASKGVEELISAWNKVSFTNLELLIIGSGELLKELKLKFETNDNVKFLDELNNQETIKLISQSRAVISCTKMYEGQPRLLSEASSNSIPSIYPSFGGMDEFFPVNYNLKFKQFDYDSLINQLRKLDNKDILLEKSKEVRSHIESLLNKEKLLSEFENTIVKIQ